MLKTKNLDCSEINPSSSASLGSWHGKRKLNDERKQLCDYRFENFIILIHVVTRTQKSQKVIAINLNEKELNTSINFFYISLVVEQKIM